MGIFCVAVIPALWVLARVFGYVAGLVIDGELSRGDFLLLFTYYLMLAFSCVELGALWLRVQESAAGLERGDLTLLFHDLAVRQDVRHHRRPDDEQCEREGSHGGTPKLHPLLRNTSQPP